jgi:hypothetical protein
VAPLPRVLARFPIAAREVRGQVEIACFSYLVEAAAFAATIVVTAVSPAAAEKPGGELHIAHRDSPTSMSILEEVTVSAVAPMMAVFNNLVVYDQHVPQNSLGSIVPDPRHQLVVER